MLVLIGLLLAGCFSKNTSQPIHILQGEVFGAYYIVKYRGNLSPEKFQTKLDEFFFDFNNEFSTYQVNSVISHFNHSGPHVPIKVSTRFIKMLELAKKFHHDSNGAFDPTLRPVIQLWGFGGGTKKRVPTNDELKKAMSLVGFHLVKWNKENLTAWKIRNGVSLDVNSFAPGWVCDLVGALLIEQGIHNFMIDLSGEILFKGSKGEDVAWVAGIEKPSSSNNKALQTAFKIKDSAISTSGNYRQFFTHQGKRKSHIIDPRSGRPVHHTISSASVISSTGAESDAWSTVMMVLGREGIALSEKNNIKVLLLEAKRKDSFEELRSPLMRSFIEANQL